MATAVVICPYCRSAVFPRSAVNCCPACGAPHHAGCWQEYGHCSVFGCPGKKITRPLSAVFFLPGILWMLFLLLPVPTAALFGPLIIPAAICSVIEVFHFGIALTKPLPSNVRFRYILYMFCNMIPIVVAVYSRT